MRPAEAQAPVDRAGGALLCRIEADLSLAAVPALLDAVARAAEVDTSSPALYRALDDSATYALLWLPADASIGDAALEEARAALAGRGDAMRLAPRIEIAGPLARRATPFHYAVETEVLPEHEADFHGWYDTEHLPGLAAVPGVARAARFANRDGAPAWYAGYDLESPDVLTSAAWLAVRATAWSDRVRPCFRNTRRTMFRVVDLD